MTVHIVWGWYFEGHSLHETLSILKVQMHMKNMNRKISVLVIDKYGKIIVGNLFITCCTISHCKIDHLLHKIIIDLIYMNDYLLFDNLH